MRYWILPIILAAIIVAFANQHQADGGDSIKIVNIEKLNSEADEEDPSPTPDGNGLLYAVKSKDSYDIFYAKRASAKVPFQAGTPFIFDKVADERCPFMFKDKYFFATNEVPDPKFTKLKNFDILVQIGFQKPAPVLGEINTKADEMYPWITPDGKEFYFSRKTDEGWKLFIAKGPIPGPIGKAKEVGFAVDFHRAAVGGSGLTMYLQGPLENGKIGIFRSTRNKVGESWTRPEPLKALNHAESKKGDMQLAVTIDGTRLYFVPIAPTAKAASISGPSPPRRSSEADQYVRASSTSVRTKQPVPPASRVASSCSAHDGPAMSRCAHGVVPTNSSRNLAAEMAPA
jgi:hypothetical protein